ncbi:hypothetical protein ACTXT7_001791 [Hymenolepis weldensis]
MFYGELLSLHVRIFYYINQGRKEYEASPIGWLCQLDHQSPTFQDNQLIWLATTATAVVVVAEYFVLILTHNDFPSNTKLSISFVRPRALPNH